jgi:excisionase family DNA binding protein
MARQDKDLMTVKEAANMMQRPRATVLSWIKSGDIEAAKSGPGKTSRYMVTTESVMRLMRSFEIPTKEPAHD